MPPPPNQPPVVVYVGHERTRSNSLANVALGMSVIALLLCWVPGVNVFVCAVAALFWCFGMLAVLFKNWNGLGYQFAATVLLVIAGAVTFVMFRAVQIGIEAMPTKTTTTATKPAH